VILVRPKSLRPAKAYNPGLRSAKPANNGLKIEHLSKQRTSFSYRKWYKCRVSYADGTTLNSAATSSHAMVRYNTIVVLKCLCHTFSCTCSNEVHHDISIRISVNDHDSRRAGIEQVIKLLLRNESHNTKHIDSGNTMTCINFNFICTVYMQCLMLRIL
jgi:hypothetical protein